MLVTAPQPLRAQLRGGTWLQQAQACAALQAVASNQVEYRATVRALWVTAQRILQARQEAKELEQELRTLVQAGAPVLLAQPGMPRARASAKSASASSA